MQLPKSYLKPEGSIMAGIATGALVYGVYSMNLGNLASVHATNANDVNATAARKKAAIQAVAVVGAVSLLAKDVTIFILGGAVTVLLDWHSRHAVAVSPDTGQLVDNTGYAPAQQAVQATQMAPVESESSYA